MGSIAVSSFAGGAAPRPAPVPGVLRAPRPELEVRRLLAQLSLWPARVGGPHALRDGRRDWQLAIKAFGSRERVRSAHALAIPGPAGPIRLRVYTPAAGSEPRGLLAYFHGGGFIVGDLYTAGGTCRALANRSGMVVVAVGYRLAPEHPLDAGRADCLAAVEWLAEHAPQLGADPERLAVGGDSAGGLLAAAVAQECARRGRPRLAAQLLVYPATDLASDTPSQHENARGYLLTRERLAWVRGEIAKVTDLGDRRLSPLHAPELGAVAPAIVVTAGFDPVRDEGLAYAERLRGAGVPVHALHHPGQIHGFVSFDRVLSGATDALCRVGHALAAATAPEGRGWGLEDGGSQLGPLATLRWLHPRQRWNEALVSGMFVREQLARRRR